MNRNISDFKRGIFSLFTRRFGSVAEFMIEALYKFSKNQNQFHDRYDDVGGKRVEIKFSRVMKANTEKITKRNIVEQIFIEAGDYSDRGLSTAAVDSFQFDCNIQQIKTAEFDVLYYGLFFIDKIAIFKIDAENVSRISGYSDKQHKGNIGERQFHIKNDNLKEHIEKYMVQYLSYDELLKLFDGLCK